MRNRLAWTFAIALTATGAWGQPWFAAAPSFEAGTSPTSVAAGDFNGDHKPDLAITNQHGLAILLNDGNGGFGPRVDYPYNAANNPQSVATGNFNSDSNLDLAVVNQGGGTVTIWIGGGNGTFQQGITYQVGVNPRRVIVLDCNNDQKDDLVIVNSGAGAGTNGVSVLLGNGDGTFQAARFTASGTTPIFVASGDFNGDHKPDLVTANTGSDDLSILLGNGDGTFKPAVFYSLNQPGITVSPTSVAVADFDHDGNLDLAAVTPSVKGYAVLLGLGNGTFQAPSHYTLDDPNSVNNNDVLVAWDMNGDSKPDLVLADYSADHVTLLFGAGDGTFPTQAAYAAGPEPIFVAVADFNGDTIPDLAVSNFNVDGVVTLLLGTGGGGLQAPPLYRSSFVPESLAIGDLNNDGIPDIVAASTGGGPGAAAGVAMMGKGDGFILGKGSGTYSAPIAWTTTGVTAIALGDFNGDGFLDLASTQQSPGNGSVSVRLGNGDGTFQPPATFSAGTTPVAIAVADLNGDHKLDLVVGNRTSSNVSVLLGNGDGTFQAATNYMTPATGTADSLVIADFNGDGRPDIAAAISGVNASLVALLIGNGDGTFQGEVPLPIGFHSSSTLHIASGDFNGDGSADLAVSDGTTLGILLGSASGTIPLPSFYTLLGTGAAVGGSIAVADFNGDALADIAVAGRDGIQILVGNGAGIFSPAAIYNPVLGGPLAVADLDGDSNPDIVTANSSADQTTTDTVAVLLNSKFVTPIALTIDTVPSGLSFSTYVGFPPGGAIAEFSGCTGPCTYNATWGRFFQIYASPSIDGAAGVRYGFDSFSDAGTSVLGDIGQIEHNVLFPAKANTELIRYKTEYQVTVAVSPATGGSATPASAGYVDANASVALKATANPGYTFTQWTASPGSSSCVTAACAPAVIQPVTWTAHFTFTGQRCDLNGDLRLTAVDAQSIVAQALGLAPPSGDLNRDGKVTIADAQLLLNAVLNAGTCPL